MSLVLGASIGDRVRDSLNKSSIAPRFC
jgi:hypothetical protein